MNNNPYTKRLLFLVFIFISFVPKNIAYGNLNSSTQKNTQSKQPPPKKNKGISIKNDLFVINSNEIERKKREIAIQDKYLKNQKKLIEEQGKILEDQKNKLEKKETKLVTQKRINLLLIALGFLSTLFMSYIVIINLNRRKLVKRLKLKNKEIAQKSALLVRQNKELEQFAYIASHDLQEPLHTISSFTEFLHEDYDSVIGKQGKEYIDYIKQGCDRMQSLIVSLLDYSRIGKERKLEHVDSELIISTIILDFNARINETSAKIKVGKMPKLYAFPVELRLLFQNLISNAIKFRKEGTTPEIFIEGQELPGNSDYKKRWQFSVKDNGIGIPNEYQNKIFDIFQRLHNKEEYEGTGIGLAHCKKIVDFHNGELWLASKEGIGTTFYFTIQFNLEDYTPDHLPENIRKEIN